MQTSPSAWCLTSALFQVDGLFVRRLARVLEPLRLSPWASHVHHLRLEQSHEIL